MFENNGFAFDTVGSFFSESTTSEYENGFSNAGPSDNFFSESAFDEMGFSNPETSVFSESAFDENGFSCDMFCESTKRPNISSEQKEALKASRDDRKTAAEWADKANDYRDRATEETRDRYDKMRKYRDAVPTSSMKEAVAREDEYMKSDEAKESMDRSIKLGRAEDSYRHNAFLYDSSANKRTKPYRTKWKGVRPDPFAKK